MVHPREGDLLLPLWVVVLAARLGEPTPQECYTRMRTMRQLAGARVEYLRTRVWVDVSEFVCCTELLCLPRPECGELLEMFGSTSLVSSDDHLATKPAALRPDRWQRRCRRLRNVSLHQSFDGQIETAMTTTTIAEPVVASDVCHQTR